MRRVIGVSTHAVNPGDPSSALTSLRPLNLQAVELSALRSLDPDPLRRTIESLDLSGYSYISFHAPGTLERYSDRDVAEVLLLLASRQWPVIAHPNVLAREGPWEQLAGQLCVENMDKRKAGGRTAAELEIIFARFPRASFCFDIGHARQVDPTMTEAALMLRRFRNRIRQIHLSEVNAVSRHEGITFTALNSFRKVAHLIPTDVPVILETPVPVDQLGIQTRLAELALTPADQAATPPQPLRGPAKVGCSCPVGEAVSQ